MSFQNLDDLLNEARRQSGPRPGDRTRVRGKLQKRLGLAAGLTAGGAGAYASGGLKLGIKALLWSGTSAVVAGALTVGGLAYRDARGPGSFEAVHSRPSAGVEPIQEVPTPPTHRVDPSAAPEPVPTAAPLQAPSSPPPYIPDGPRTSPRRQARSVEGPSSFGEPTPLAAEPSASYAAGRGGERGPGGKQTRAPGTLSVELEFLADAQRAMRRGETSKALELLDLHAITFPHGLLQEERTAARTLALCALGRRSDAEREARRFLREWPRSPFRSRVLGSCGAPGEDAEADRRQ